MGSHAGDLQGAKGGNCERKSLNIAPNQRRRMPPGPPSTPRLLPPGSASKAGWIAARRSIATWRCTISLQNFSVGYQPLSVGDQFSSKRRASTDVVRSANQILWDVGIDQNHGCKPRIYPASIFSKHAIDITSRISMLHRAPHRFELFLQTADELSAARKVERLPHPFCNRHAPGASRPLNLHGHGNAGGAPGR